MEFTVESHYTPHLAPDAGQVDAIISVSLEGDNAAPEAPQRRVLGFIADRSGSMSYYGRIEAVQAALNAAIAALDRDSIFFIVGFDTYAEAIFAPASATPENKRLAAQRVAGLQAGGGTAMSSGLELALGFFRSYPAAINRGLFLTDGKNESEKIEAVQRILASCEG